MSEGDKTESIGEVAIYWFWSLTQRKPTGALSFFFGFFTNIDHIQMHLGLSFALTLLLILILVDIFNFIYSLLPWNAHICQLSRAITAEEMFPSINSLSLKHK